LAEHDLLLPKVRCRKKAITLVRFLGRSVGCSSGGAADYIGESQLIAGKGKKIKNFSPGA